MRDERVRVHRLAPEQHTMTAATARLLFLSLLSLCSFIIGVPDESQCRWRNSVTKSTPEIFWINMDKTVSRRVSMEKHLNAYGLPHRRVRGLSFDDIYIPSDVVTGWETQRARAHTAERIPPRNDSNFVSQYGNISHVIVGLFGRPKSNRIKEVGCTSSHLEAMRLAIYHNRTESKYAIITEDDVFFPFNVDFDKLIASAPQDFGILQIFNSNGDSMKFQFERFRKFGELWSENRPHRNLAFWSTCAYIINREVMKPMLDRIMKYSPDDDRFHMQLVASFDEPCRPLDAACCRPSETNSKQLKFVHNGPCVVSFKGYQADAFIYALNKTYVLNVPIVANGAGGNLSTFHQDHVELLHHAAFQRLRGYVNDLSLQRVKPPDFLTAACPEGLPVAMSLSVSESCSYQTTYNRKNATAIYWLTFTDRLLAMSAMQQYFAATVPYKNSRVFGIRESQLFVPADLRDRWDSSMCAGVTGQLKLDDTKQQDELVRAGFHGAMVGLCGRTRESLVGHAGEGDHNGKTVHKERASNWPTLNPASRDLSLTVSHLWAIHQAATGRSPASSSPFAMIIEDDVQFPFDIDIDALAALAPPDFVFLRLFLSEDRSLKQSWERYTANHSNLFTRYDTHLHYSNASLGHKFLPRDDLSTKAYIVNLDRMSDILKRVVPEVHWYNRGEKLFPMFNVRCCESSRSADSHSPDIFLWSLGTTYTLNVPLVTAQYGDQRGKHQPKKKKILDERIHQQRKLINQLLVGQVSIPSFAKYSCKRPLPLV